MEGRCKPAFASPPNIHRSVSVSGNIHSSLFYPSLSTPTPSLSLSFFPRASSRDPDRTRPRPSNISPTLLKQQHGPSQALSRPAPASGDGRRPVRSAL
ncbi:unnamed protein product [Ectocarpus sp. 12 AP-2014]